MTLKDSSWHGIQAICWAITMALAVVVAETGPRVPVFPYVFVCLNGFLVCINGLAYLALKDAGR